MSTKAHRKHSALARLDLNMAPFIRVILFYLVRNDVSFTNVGTIFCIGVDMYYFVSFWTCVEEETARSKTSDAVASLLDRANSSAAGFPAHAGLLAPLPRRNCWYAEPKCEDREDGGDYLSPQVPLTG